MSAIHELQAVTPAEAFDNVAEVFDTAFENEITARLREKTYAVISSVASRGSSILDINCGTGIDALELARRGYDVVGLDIAPKMIEIAQEKAQREGISNARFQFGSFECLTETADGRFDVVISNFGGLNCVNELDTVAQQIASVAKPGGHFVATVMPRVCVWEIAAGLSRLNTRSAFRRFHQNTPATGFRGKTFTVFYHPLRKMVSAFSPWFQPVKILGLNIFSPPPHATTFLHDNLKLSRFLERCDDVLGQLPIIRAMGDHYMIILRRKDDSASSE